MTEKGMSELLYIASQGNCLYSPADAASKKDSLDSLTERGLVQIVKETPQGRVYTITERGRNTYDEVMRFLNAPEFR